MRAYVPDMDPRRPTIPPARKRKGLDRRGELLAAAARILQTGGVQALTLDAVAREAATSKGGLLHHFQSKPKLLEAMLDDCLARIQEDLSAFVEADADPRGRRQRAYIHTLIAPPKGRGAATILALLMVEKDAAIRWIRFSSAWFEADMKEESPGRSGTIRTLAIGAWLTMALGLCPSEGSSRSEILQGLLQFGRS